MAITVAVTADFQACTEYGTVLQIIRQTHTSSNSSIDTSLIRDIYCGLEVLFETCAMKFVDDDDDWPSANKAPKSTDISCHQHIITAILFHSKIPTVA